MQNTRLLNVSRFKSNFSNDESLVETEYYLNLEREDQNRYKEISVRQTTFYDKSSLQEVYYFKRETFARSKCIRSWM